MPSPTALDLAHFLPYRLSILSNTVSQEIASDYEQRFELTVTQWRVMAVLGHEEDIAARDVSVRTAMDKVAISRAVSDLVKRNLILRRVSPTDKRESRLRLSAAGWRIHDQIVPMAVARERELLARLTPEEQQWLARILDRLQPVETQDSVSLETAAQSR